MDDRGEVEEVGGGMDEPLLPPGGRARRRRQPSPSAPASGRDDDDGDAFGGGRGGPRAAAASLLASDDDEDGTGGGGDELAEDAKWWSGTAAPGVEGGGDRYDGHGGGGGYDKTFLPPVVPVARAIPSAPERVRVDAPAALAPGYSFVATLEDGRAFTVTVEEEGVDEGETVEAEYPTDFLATTAVPPSGHWKDGLCACCRFGCCHPMFCLPWCCPLVALGQIMMRMRLTWLANPTSVQSRARHTFAILVFLEALHLLISFVFGGVVPRGRLHTVLEKTLAAVALTLVLFQIYITAATRRRIRRRYDIPGGDCCCGGCCDCCPSLCGGICEDCCRAAFCGCCTVAQMGRHTADYETFRGVCCSSTGLPVMAPVV